MRRPTDQSPDWREWFRSTDCDDAWSPYIPFSNKGDKNSMSSLGKLISGTKPDPVSALLEGTWRKRRHGMNLEPLHMHQTVSEEGVTDDADIQDVSDETLMNSTEISSLERISNDTQQAVTKARARLKWLDSQTRFLCSMLDDLYRTGIRRQIDRARTERCHRVSGFIVTNVQWF